MSAVSERIARQPAPLHERAPACRVCGSSSLRLVRRGTLPASLEPRHFRITDSAYGQTTDIEQCADCGFRQSSAAGDVLHFYEDMSDDVYEDGREARAIQARVLLKSVAKFCASGRLLDVGAGSGILVSEALKRGYDAQGIEPSRALALQAARHRLPVHHGTLPSEAVRGPFNAATVIDVIEHVSDPVGLMRSVRNELAPAGIVAVVTPDAASFAARLLGWRWWHYRIAHIGYFSPANLRHAMERAGFETVAMSRPGWYFPASYLAERAVTYLPAPLRFRPPRALDKLIVPLNLFDSLLVIARKK